VRNAAAGSEVFVNNVSQGKTAVDGTLKIYNLDAGNLEVKISHPEYADFTASVTGEAGKEAAVEALMLPLAISYGNSPMVLIPAGEFVMGNDDTDAEDEKPEHKVTLPAFYMDQYEVTNAEYKRFCDATGKTPPPNPAWDPNYFTGSPDYPVLGVTFNQAVEYARWAGKRLPTEQEWEKAASWDPLENKKRVFPWGSTAARGRTNVGTNKPVAVKQLADDRSPYGVHGMAGNAFEWVDAVYKPYPGNEKPNPNYEMNYGVTRGAAFIDAYKIDDARTTYRNFLQKDFPPGMTTPVGFRCAISADDSRLQQAIRSRNQ
jgi:iron(II)-dependent oxidoreductase